MLLCRILTRGLVNTNLSPSGEYKLERFGGPQKSQNVEAADRVMQFGMDPDEVGRTHQADRKLHITYSNPHVAS